MDKMIGYPLQEGSSFTIEFDKDKMRLAELLVEAKKKHERPLACDVPFKRKRPEPEIPLWLRKSQQRDA